MSDNEVDFSLFVRREFPTRFFARGTTIFREGEQGDEFFVVVRGKVEIRSGNRHLEILGPQGIFGEMALIDDGPRSATVVALTDVTVAADSRTAVSFHGQAHAVLRTKGDARPRQPAAPAEQGSLRPGLASRPWGSPTHAAHRLRLAALRGPGANLCDSRPSPLELPSTTCRSAAYRRCRRCGRSFRPTAVGASGLGLGDSLRLSPVAVLVVVAGDRGEHVKHASPQLQESRNYKR